MAEEKEKIIPPAPATPKYRERLKARYPDSAPQSDEEWDDLAERAFAEDADKIGNFEKNDKVIQDLLDSDKDLAAVVSEMIVNGTPFRAAVAKYYDPESLVAKEGDEDYEYYQKSVEDRKKAGQEFRARAAERRNNSQSAYDNIDAFAEKNGMTPEQKKGFLDYINDFYNDLSMLKLSPEMLDKLYKAMNYDKDVAAAAATGEIEGKNQAIEATRVKAADSAAGDGIPTPKGGSSPARDKEPAPKTIFDDLPKRKF